MSASLDGSDAFVSFLEQQSFATTNTEQFLEASDIPLSQDSDVLPDDNMQALLTQGPAQSFSNDSDDEFQSVPPDIKTGSVNQDTTSPSVSHDCFDCNDIQRRSSLLANQSESTTPQSNESDSPPKRTVSGLIDMFGGEQSNTILASSPESNVHESPRHGNSFFMMTQPPVEDEEGERSHDDSDAMTETNVGRMPSPSKTERAKRTDAKSPPQSPANSSHHSDTFNATFQDNTDDLPLHSHPESACQTTTSAQESTSSNSDEEDSSSSDEDDEVKRRLIIEENEKTRRARIQRNQNRLVSLGLISSPQHAMSQSPMSNDSSPGETYNDDIDDLPNGMLLKSSFSTACQGDDSIADVDELYKRYPHRNAEIKTLISLIESTMGQTEFQGDDPFVPPPIFVSGPSGCGKTSIVRDVVETLQRYYSARLDTKKRRVIGTAYVNCAAIEPASVEAVLETAYSQLMPPESSRDSKRERIKQKRKKAPTSDEPVAKQPRRASDGDVFGARMSAEDVDKSVHSNDGEYDSDYEAALEDRMEEIQALATQIEPECMEPDESTVDPPTSRKTRHSKKNGTLDRRRRNSAANVPKTGEKSIRKTEAVTKSHGAPLAFGRVLSPLFGPSSLLSMGRKPGSAFLILDHAERLFALSALQKAEPNNFLAQLLLLPQVMGLNLTLIIVSRSTLLDCSRINNSAPVQTAIGIIANGVRPVRVHFPAYRGKEVFIRILRQPRITELIVGRSHSSVVTTQQKDDSRLGFQGSTVDSFLDTVVQSMSSITRDTREMIRIGRALWPTYILPLSPQNIPKTLDVARQRLSGKKRCGPVESVLVGTNSIPENNVKDLQKEILAFLDESILPRIKNCLEDELFVVKGDDTPSATEGNTSNSAATDVSQYDLPYLSKCLLLAAFVCQSNKPDKDKALFTIQRNGKKNSRQGHLTGNDDAEGLAYGSTTWEQKRLKMLRPRTFPLERMLSVFVSIVGLIGGEEKLALSSINKSAHDDMLNSIGSACFFESLARLREIGVLHEVQGSSTAGGGDGLTSFDGINMTSTKYWCDLNRDGAESLAASVDFPLAEFLL